MAAEKNDEKINTEPKQIKAVESLKENLEKYLKELDDLYNLIPLPQDKGLTEGLAEYRELLHDDIISLLALFHRSISEKSTVDHQTIANIVDALCPLIYSQNDKNSQSPIDQVNEQIKDLQEFNNDQLFGHIINNDMTFHHWHNFFSFLRGCDDDIYQNLAEEIETIKAFLLGIYGEVTDILITNLKSDDKKSKVEDVYGFIRDNINEFISEFYKDRSLQTSDNIKADIPQNLQDQIDIFNGKKGDMPDDIARKIQTKIDETKTEHESYGIGNSYKSMLDELKLAIALPWNKSFDPNNIDLDTIEHRLSADYSDTQSSKIIASLLDMLYAEQARLKNADNKTSPNIICFSGPPGIGKTSISLKMAELIKRPHHIIALGGTKEAAPLIGFHSTYKDSQTGELLKAIAESECNNPIIILDEIDKAPQEVQNALLSILDPEQNKEFRDAYLDEFPVDLSKILFICTANDTSKIISPLKSRLSITHIGGYTRQEKINIAEKVFTQAAQDVYISPNTDITWDEGAIEYLIAHFTRESGLRQLKNKIETLMTRIGRIGQIDNGNTITITPDLINEELDGYMTAEKIPSSSDPGDILGLYFSDNGGGILPIQSGNIVRPAAIETTKLVGSSSQRAFDVARMAVQTYLNKNGLKSDANLETLKNTYFTTLPGGTPVDGPSLGAACAVSLLSRIYNIKIPTNFAMTGEVDASGNILEIGGVKEKLDGALNAGVKTVFIPTANEYSLRDVPDDIKDRLTIHTVSNIAQAFDTILKLTPGQEQDLQHQNLQALNEKTSLAW